MYLLFCDSGFSHKEVDYLYTEEYEAAKAAGFTCALLSFEHLKKGAIDKALKQVKATDTKTIAIYRGWMLKPLQYEQLYTALLEKNIQLVNNPEEYRFCHYLPENYPTIQAYTPKTSSKALVGNFDIADFKTELDLFGNQPIVLKDYVKSQKHYWEEACFIPNAADRPQAEKVIRRFLDLQGEDLNEGLVFRAFVDLEALTTHSVSGMPLTKEFRVFVYQGAILASYPYWAEGDYENVQPVLEHFKSVLPKIKSNFFTLDIAKQAQGDWIIVELGDGQVAGLPDRATPKGFYEALKQLY